MTKEKRFVESLLKGTGITINGNSPSDPHIHNENLYARVLRDGSLGLGEAYMDGWWDCEDLPGLFYKIYVAKLDERITGDWKIALTAVWNAITNAGRKSKAFEVGEHHYDTGNDLYQATLGKRLAYTCGYWKDARNLDEAQEAKLDLVCQKIGVKPGQTVLDIGSGWGSFTGYAAEKYGARATGITVSKEQKAFADKRYANLPVETLLQDYRDIRGTFDHIVSIGMFEHVGYKNYRAFMEVARNALRDDGLFLLHTIGSNRSVKAIDPWLGKYIFPNSMLPSMSQISAAAEGLFVIEDWHNFGIDYDTTLMAWYENLNANWDTLKEHYDERFYRMWKYYLSSCAGAFRARGCQLWQIVLSKNGVQGGYVSIR